MHVVKIVVPTDCTWENNSKDKVVECSKERTDAICYDVCTKPKEQSPSTLFAMHCRLTVMNETPFNIPLLPCLEETRPKTISESEVNEKRICQRLHLHVHKSIYMYSANIIERYMYILTYM